MYSKIILNGKPVKFVKSANLGLGSPISFRISYSEVKNGEIVDEVREGQAPGSLLIIQTFPFSAEQEEKINKFLLDFLNN